MNATQAAQIDADRAGLLRGLMYGLPVSIALWAILALLVVHFW